MPIKDAFEMLIKIFDGKGTEFVKDPADFHAIISMRVPSILGGDQHPVIALAERMQVGRVVMAIPQHETDFGGHFAQQFRSRLTIGDIGWCQHGSDGKPDGCHHRDDVPFPAINESTTTPIWSNGPRYQWRYGGFPHRPAASDASPPPGA